MILIRAVDLWLFGMITLLIIEIVCNVMETVFGGKRVTILYECCIVLELQLSYSLTGSLNGVHLYMNSKSTDLRSVESVNSTIDWKIYGDRYIKC